MLPGTKCFKRSSSSFVSLAALVVNIVVELVTEVEEIDKVTVFSLESVLV